MPEQCDACREYIWNAEAGCYHDGRALCEFCLHNCPQCRAAIRYSDARAAVRLQPIRRPALDLRPRKRP